MSRFSVFLLTPALVFCAACATRQPIEQPADTAARPVGMGTVKCLTTAERVELLTDKGVARSGEGGTIQLVAGSYNVLACSLRAKDAQGGEWRIVGQAGQPLDVKANETVELTFGAPLKATVVARKVGNNEYAFSPKITGQGGEFYSPRDITRNGSTPPAPKLEIRDGSGTAVKTISSGRFRYG